ncbi:MAG: TrkH family potassium uptake protein [Coriobacteriia bacterium]
MWLRMRITDLRVVSHYAGLFIIGIGLTMFVPLATALLWAEWSAALDYVLGIGVAFAVGGAMRLSLANEVRVTRAQALALVAFAWVAASAVGAVPLAASGEFGSFLDAMFETVSGFTTSGLTLARDLDHMAYSHNMWRHLTHFIGGQGIIVAALSISVGMRGGAFSLYQAEGRDERILPNVLHTARFIWVVAVTYIVLGTVILGGIGLWLGMSIDRSILHAFWMSTAAYDTGGFAPQTLNIMYYHSPAYEFGLLLLMIGGMINFNLHAQVWRGDGRELWRNIETRTLAINVAILSVLAAVGMVAVGFYAEAPEIWRKGLFHIISAHSGTGHQAFYARQWAEEFSGAGFAAILLAMAAGGAVSSTAGGIKALRLGIIAKSVLHQVKEALAPPSARVTTIYHHLDRRTIDPAIVGAAATVFIMYTIVYITGGLVGAAYGYDAAASLFESISATANVGLSAGITSPGMPGGLKIVYMVQMWAGRLEFIGVLVLIAWVLVAVRNGVERMISR